MLAYAYTSYFGHDALCNIETSGNPGDIIYTDNEIFLVLGEDDLAKKKHTIQSQQQKSVRGFFTDSTITFIDRMVSHRYSRYKKIVPLFMLPEHVHNPKRPFSKRLLNKKKNSAFSYNQSTHSIEAKAGELSGQQLFLFPSLRSASQAIIQAASSNVALMHSGLTSLQKYKIQEGVRSGKITAVCATHSQCFHDWNNLEEIHIIHPDSRYYKNSQDPRYVTLTVANKMAEIYSANISLHGSYLLST